MEQKKAYIYTRVSTEMQIDGFSLDGQISEIEDFCSRNNILIVGRYSDKGKSGASIAKRDDFKRMLQDIELRKDNVDFVVVYKLSRFGRSLIDTMNSLQILNDNKVALRTADGAINTSETMGRLITTILAAVAEMELENIHEQTFLGRQQKAREGKWNGGFSPYGYRISDGITNEPDILVIEEEEAKIVRLIYDYYTKDKLGVAGIVTECDRLGIRKIPRKNSTLTRMNRKFVSDVLSNPVYCGKIAYGRRHLEKPDKTGKRKMVKPQDYILVDGRHEAIVSYEQFQEAQRLREARAPMCVRRADNEHAHLLATLIKCPVCGAKLYGNTTRKKKPNGEIYKDYHFYACKHRLKVNGATCTFRTNINERDIDEPVVAIISKLINDPHLAELLSSKLDNSTDKKTVEEAIQAQKKLLDTVNANIARLTNQLDHLDYSSPIAERKAADMENRLNNLYNEVMQHEQYLDELYQRLYAINQNLLTKDAVLNILKQFSKLYEVMTPADRQILIRTIVDEIQIYPEKQADGRIIKSIKLAIPIVYENGETPKISWDKETTVESVVCLSREKADDCKKETKMISDERSRYKSWSNLKKQMHDLLCDSLKDKISYFYTNYHEVHNAYGRATINYNKEEMIAFSWDIGYAKWDDEYTVLNETNVNIQTLGSFQAVWDEQKRVQEELNKSKWMPECKLCDADFINSLTIYLKTDIATSLNSDNYLLRVFAYMDRRVGKRTLIKIKDEVEKLPDWVKQFYQIRCEADGIIFPPKQITDESIACLVRE